MPDELEQLNKICKDCLEERRKLLMCPPNPVTECANCPTGVKVHKLENPKWGDVDWNSSKWEQLYRN